MKNSTLLVLMMIGLVVFMVAFDSLEAASLGERRREIERWGQ
jgi:hypothetical protein